MQITTNSNRRPILDSWELTDKEARQFDFLDWDKLREGNDSASFFRYRGEVHYLGDFMRIETDLPALAEFGRWDGYRADSYFSGLLVRYAIDEDNGDDMIVVASYHHTG